MLKAVLSHQIKVWLPEWLPSRSSAPCQPDGRHVGADLTRQKKVGPFLQRLQITCVYLGKRHVVSADATAARSTDSPTREGGASRAMHGP